MSDFNLRRFWTERVTGIGLTILGNLVFNLSQWIMLMRLNEYGGMAQVGVFTYSLAICSPLMLLAGAGLRPTQIVDTSDDYNISSYTLARILTGALGAGLVILLSLALRVDTHTLRTTSALTLAKFIELQSESFTAHFQRNGQMRLVGSSMCLKAMLGLAAFEAGLRITESTPVASLALGAGWLLALGLFDFRRLRANREALITRAGERPLEMFGLLKAIRRSGPLALQPVLTSAQTSLPRFFTEGACGFAAVGALSSLTYLVHAIGLTVNAIGQDLAPRLARSFSERHHRRFASLLRQALVTSLLFGAGAVLVTMIAGGSMLRLLFGPLLVAHQPELVVLLAGAVVNYTGALLSIALVSLGVVRYNVPVHLMSLIFIAVGCYCCVSSDCVRDAAWVIAAGSVLGTALFAVAFQSSWRLKVGSC